MKLYLIRHGESANNAFDSGTGEQGARVPDPELTEIGHQQAKLLAGHMADPQGDPLQHPSTNRRDVQREFGLTHIYCSLMTRSILTAQYVAQACGLPLIAHAEIFESEGVYEEASDGTKTGVPGPDRDYFSTRFSDIQLPETLGDGGWYNRPFETKDKFLRRSKQIVQEFLHRHAGTDDTVAMVIHGDLIDQLVNDFVGVERRPANYDIHWVANWAVHNTAITRIDFIAESRVVVYTNRTQHLPPEMITW